VQSEDFDNEWLGLFERVLAERAIKDPDEVEPEVWNAFCVYAMVFCPGVMEW
jgi:hypothetical protein